MPHVDLDKLPYPIDEILAELRREQKMRAAVYPRLVQNGKMSPDDAKKRQELLRGAVIVFAQLAKNERGLL